MDIQDALIFQELFQHLLALSSHINQSVKFILYHFSLLHTNPCFHKPPHGFANNTKYLGVAGMGHVRWYTILFYLSNSTCSLSSISLSVYFYSLLPSETEKQFCHLCLGTIQYPWCFTMHPKKFIQLDLPNKYEAPMKSK